MKRVLLTILATAGTLSNATPLRNQIDRYHQLVEDAHHLQQKLELTSTELAHTYSGLSGLYSFKPTRTLRKSALAKQAQLLAQIGRIKEEMGALEATLTVPAWTPAIQTDIRLEAFSTPYLWTPIEIARVPLGSVATRRVLLKSGQSIFFTDDRAFESWFRRRELLGLGHFFDNGREIEDFADWFRDNNILHLKAAYYTRQNPYLSNCLRRTNDAEEVKIERVGRYLCKRANLLKGEFGRYQYSPVKYNIYKNEGLINLDAKLCFDYKGEDRERRAQAFAKLKGALPCMMDFYARYGIKLNLDMVDITDSNQRPALKECGHPISLYDSYPRVNVLNWATDHAFDRDLNDSARCVLFTHEFSHWLGLGDSYQDFKNCPGRQGIMPQGHLMQALPNNTNIGQSWLAPEDIQKITAPLCEKN